MDFRENLTRLRLEKHMTQMDLAEATGVSLDVVVQWENGDSEPPIKDLLSISEALDVSVDFLLGKAEKEDTKESEDPGEVTLCPCCGREVKGSICLACEFPVAGYQSRGPKYAITSLGVYSANTNDTKLQVMKYCGITEEEELQALLDGSTRKILKRGLSDVAVHWIASRIDSSLLCLRIVEDQGEPEEELLNKPVVMETPKYIYKKENSGIGVGGVIIIVVLTIIVLSIF